MKYKIDTIITDVRIMLRENAVAPVQPIRTSQLTIDQWITSRLPSAVEAEHLSAPTAAFDNPLSFVAPVSWMPTLPGAGRLSLPPDFLRLIAFSMSDWDAAVHSAISPESPAYARQQSPHIGVRGNHQRPVCAIVPSASGPVFEFYSSLSTDAVIEQALYVPRPAIAADHTIDIAPPCYHSVVARLAAQFASPTNRG